MPPPKIPSKPSSPLSEWKYPGTQAGGGESDLPEYKEGRGKFGISRSILPAIRENIDPTGKGVISEDDWGGRSAAQGIAYHPRSLRQAQAANAFSSARGSTFDDATTASGLPRSVPGIALPSSSTVGHWYEVVGPNGQRMVLRQTDFGPAAWTGRGIDINAPAAALAGYTERNFPNDEQWQYRHLGESLPPGIQAGIQQDEATAARAVAQAVADPGIIDYTSQSGLRHVGGFEHGKPEGMIIHHTSGGGGVEGVAATLRGRGLGVQYVIDREGKTYRLLPEGEKAWHAGVNYYNKNYAGVEIIAKDDKDVNEKQMAAAGQLVGWHSKKYGYDPKTNVKGHGEVSSNKEADEGRKVVTALRAGTLNLGGASAGGPKLGSQAYWEQGRAKAGETQVAHQGTPGTTTQPGQGLARP